MENRYLFRGKRIDNGEWVEGYLSYPFCTENGNESYYFYAKDSLGFFCRCVVDASTICQCTGLKDKNGKLIWENDVIRCNYETSIVKWEKSEWRIKWIDEAVWRRDLDYWVNESKREVNVVGNIFDNPELLEGSYDD